MHLRADRSLRYGLPRGLGGLTDVINSPAWATAAGLLRYAQGRDEARARSNARPGFSVRNMVGSLRGMFQDLL